MFQQLGPLFTLVVLLTSTVAVPQPRWVRRQENAQTALTLDPGAISPGLAQDGQGDTPDPGQVRSLTTTNNYINYCLTQPDVPLTNGKQVQGGSCNQTPMGQIIPLDNSPRAKFVFPPNGDDSLVAGQAFTIQLRIDNMITGFFTNAQATYYAAPQQLNNGIVIGHSHVVVEELPDLQTTEPLNPLLFKFFKGLNNAAQGGILTADVTNGLEAGVYRLCSINTAANHQPVIVSNAQHGGLDDCVYFTVRDPNAEETETETETGTETETATGTETETGTETDATATETGVDATETGVDATETETAPPEATESVGGENEEQGQEEQQEEQQQEEQENEQEQEQGNEEEEQGDEQEQEQGQEEPEQGQEEEQEEEQGQEQEQEQENEQEDEQEQEEDEGRRRGGRFARRYQ